MDGLAVSLYIYPLAHLRGSNGLHICSANIISRDSKSRSHSYVSYPQKPQSTTGGVRRPLASKPQPVTSRLWRKMCENWRAVTIDRQALPSISPSNPSNRSCSLKHHNERCFDRATAPRYINLSTLRQRWFPQAGPRFDLSLFDYFAHFFLRIVYSYSSNPRRYLTFSTSQTLSRSKQVTSWDTFVLASSAAACPSGSVSSVWPFLALQEDYCSVSEDLLMFTTIVRIFICVS